MCLVVGRYSDLYDCIVLTPVLNNYYTLCTAIQINTYKLKVILYMFEKIEEKCKIGIGWVTIE